MRSQLAVVLPWLSSQSSLGMGQYAHASHMGVARLALGGRGSPVAQLSVGLDTERVSQAMDAVAALITPNVT